MREGTIRASVAAGLAILLSVACLVGGSAPRNPQPGSEDLARQRLFSRHIDAGKLHHYHLRVPAGQAAVVTLHQLGESDVALTALSPRGAVSMDHDTRSWGDERLTLIAGSRETLFLLEVEEVGGGDSPAGRPRYGLSAAPAAPVRGEDLHRARAEQLWAEGYGAVDQAVKRDRFARAAGAWEVSGDTVDEAQALLELAWLDQEADDFESLGVTATAAYRLLREEASGRPDLIALCLYYLGVSRSNENRPDEAVDYLERALRILDRIPELPRTRRLAREELGCWLSVGQ